MNQLPINVIDIALYRRAASVSCRMSAPDFRLHSERTGALVCHWSRDAATGRLRCAWSTLKGAREAQPPSRLSLAS